MASVRWIISTAPEIFLLLTVTIGTILGRVRVRGFAIGTIACATGLLACLLSVKVGSVALDAVFPPRAPHESGSHLWRARRCRDGRRRRDAGCCEIAESQTPALGVAVPYAVGKVVLTVLGPIIVACTFVG